MVASVGPRGARKRCERWELCRDPSLGVAREPDSASSRMTEWAQDNIFGEFSDIDADVLGVKRAGQECPPYTCSLRFARGSDAGVRPRCALAADVGVLRWESCGGRDFASSRMTASAQGDTVGFSTY
jgi:hypothetical protein